MPRILVVDDNTDILEALDLLLSLHGYDVVTASSKKEAELAVNHQVIDLVIQDMNFSLNATSGDEGVTLFHALRQINQNLPIILITAWSQLENAVELVKSGAVDYLQKPWDDRKLLEKVGLYCRQQSTERMTSASTPFVFKSVEMINLVAQAEKVAQSDINILITGANGAGKEKLADHIHAHSARSEQALIKVNMGALPQDLMEAELFGAEKGAFTGANAQRQGRFEAADGGTLFLDEIGNLPLAGQMKLLRVLQTGEFEKLGSSQTQRVDVRVISATNSDLPAAVTRGEFREDLYYRLNVLELHLPPLRQRKEDILPLAEHFIGDAYQLSSSARDYLLAQPWPGNVRELENACERAKVLSNGHLLDVNAFTANAAVVAKSEQERVEAALQKCGGVIKHAAHELGLSRQALYRRIEKYQLDLDKYGE